MVDPNKLAAFAKQPPGGGKNPKPGQQPPKGGGETPEGAEGEETQEGGEGEFSALLPLLEAAKDELEANCDELDAEALQNPEGDMSDEDKQILIESFQELPKDLRAEMVKSLAGIEKDDAMTIAQHLADEDMIDDANRTAGYFVRVGALIDSGDLTADEDEEDEEDDEESDDDSEDAGDDDSGEYEADEG